MTATFRPPLPYPEFPLRPHKNGQWFKSVWNVRNKKSEQFYLGSWADDPAGERAISDPDSGWLARRDAIRAGIDNVRVETLAASDICLGELMARFLMFKRDKVTSGELSLAPGGVRQRIDPVAQGLPDHAVTSSAACRGASAGLSMALQASRASKQPILATRCTSTSASAALIAAAT